MEIKVIQKSIGRFNLLSPDKGFVFKMGIYTDAGEIAVSGGEKAILYFFGEPEDYDYFNDPICNLDEVFEKCWDYSKNVFGSTNYKGQCLAFWNVYNEFFTDINSSYVDQERQRLEKKIKQLTDQLNQNIGLTDLSWAGYHVFKGELSKYEEWAKASSVKLEQMKEGTEMHSKEMDKFNRYNQLIKEYKLLVEKSNC